MEKIYLAGLHYIGFTHKKLFTVFDKKQNYKEVFENINYKYLKEIGFLDKQIEIILKRYGKTNLDFLKTKLERRKAKIITIFDDDYPESLRHIPNPPFLLYVRGELSSKPNLAIVGTRKISNYGEKIIENFIPELSKYFTIVSGGAAGCDTKAHTETLKNNGTTISVIGTGIDQNYPVSNTVLYNKIVENKGAIISIFPVGEIGNPYNFPIRNEIVVGLSLGTIIIEAAKKSGSLITAQLTLDLGKELFAIPGEIFKNYSLGTNHLISNQEAKMTLSIEDILNEFNIKSNPRKIKKEIEFSNSIQKKIYNELTKGNTSFEKLIKNLNIEVNDLSSNLSILEIQKIISKNNLGDYEIN